jgi:hypothetical protein
MGVGCYEWWIDFFAVSSKCTKTHVRASVAEKFWLAIREEKPREGTGGKRREGGEGMGSKGKGGLGSGPVGFGGGTSHSKNIPLEERE